MESLLTEENLLKLATVKMPFGRYAGRVLIDLPEEYLLWFNRADKGFPKGKLGQLMQLALMLKIDGTDGLIKRLKAGHLT
ncbi:DUF3820 family protein [Ignatzschineria cameli]|uniref:Cytoplasmic protein n=1 Tax=Ignatzschineria cameli TaxID=2182793 RepID=A0A2U2AU28_9GAMM|nr:DUF3820 family protein [Ignatzschineria cameli]PWD87287.1 hypothetical protein DC080_00215 [Ignatzschineria cameli]PWD88224.1 hypothetical protein DC077_02850 [Ignatzschineria cameli]PWD91253.1 hypothetical protein DC079_03595 [Ignatzschineria cameli]PWD92894.1 hypothetical protein DC081_03595 [Ignatzschineria cameli]PWD93915.1 hypothetical protein DC078_03595 [Ignatzschineria cameli]